MNDYNILSPELTVQALRDSGYRSTAYAISELIDNSIDAGATDVDVIVEECQTPEVARWRVHRIAVADNGEGMDEDTLRRALKFGDGHGRQSGRIGRFGMGLPNSSLSQCQRVDVWSWQNGPDNALKTHLDLEEIKTGSAQVPQPERDPVPQEWRDMVDVTSQTGTLVVWSELDRHQWFRATSTFDNTESLIGRVYRHRIASGDVAIRLVPVRDGEPTDDARPLRVNDPLYLMSPSTTPEPFDTEPMFKVYPLGDEEDGSARIPIEANGAKHDVFVRASIAKPHARRSDVEGHPWPTGVSSSASPGSLPWGKHAKGNMGISVLRERRELDLDSAWTDAYDPTERFWGLEIEFPSDLDEVFGVTNTKQAATVFHQLAGWSVDDELQDGESEGAMKERLREEEDPRAGLIELATFLHNKRLALRRELAAQTLGTRPGSRKRHEEETNRQATDFVNKRRDEGHTGQTDSKEESTSEEERRKEQVESLTDRHRVPRQDAEDEVDDGIAKQLRARWVSAPADTPAFFSVETLAGMLQVVFNTEHPAYDRLEALLEPPVSAEDNDDPADLRRRLQETSTTLKLLLFSWARFEDELSTEKARSNAAQHRADWGRMARYFFEEDE